MPRRNKDSQHQSMRWPALFKDREKAESLFSAVGWTELVEDLLARKKELSEGIEHNIPYTPEHFATQNFDRGCCSVLQDLIEIVEEFKLWKEQK